MGADPPFTFKRGPYRSLKNGSSTLFSRESSGDEVRWDTMDHIQEDTAYKTQLRSRKILFGRESLF